MKAGEYVRTDYGCIAKIKKFWVYHNVKFITTDKDTISESMIVKSSPNIIDLIDVGDVLSYKDGSICRIMEITDKGYCLLKDYGGEQYYESKEWLKDIKSIVTKEQFSQMEYRIGE